MYSWVAPKLQPTTPQFLKVQPPKAAAMSRSIIIAIPPKEQQCYSREIMKVLLEQHVM